MQFSLILGESLVGNIFENMVASRKVIAVLSQNYLTDKMHMFELDLAIDEMYEKTIEEIIVVHIDRGLPERKIPRYCSFHTDLSNTFWR